MIQKKNVNMNLTPKIIKLIKAEAKKTSRSFCGMVEWMVTQYVSKKEKA